MQWVPDMLTAVAVLGGLFAAVMTTINLLRFRRCIQRSVGEPLSGYAPKAAVIIPCKGVDSELPAAVRTLLAQNYPNYEMFFVLENEQDPAAALVQEALDTAPRNPGLTRAEMVFAGQSVDCGQKVHNLRAGLDRVSADVAVFAFVDSDCRPHPLWLRRLVAPLADPATGAATGYRWYAPIRGGLAPALLSLWNANTAIALAVPRRAFVWGGSMALRRETFDAIKVLERWQGSLSDDYNIRSAVRRGGLGIGFAPQCLVLSPADMTWRQVWEFICRQFVITRVYAASFWRFTMIYTSLLLAGLAALPAAALLPEPPSPALRIGVLAGAGAVWLLTLIHGFQRLSAMKLAFPGEASGRRKSAAIYVLGTPLLTLVNLTALIRAAWCRTIVWRGIKYVLHSSKRLTIERPG